MTTILTPVLKQHFVDNSGNPLNQGTLASYQAGSTTPLATYTDSTGSTSNTNPIVLDARGEASVWIPPNVAYKFVLSDSLGNPIWTIDNVTNSQLVTLYGGVDTGSSSAYILNFTANFTAYADGILIYWVPAHNSGNVGSTVNVNSLGVVTILNTDGTQIYANQIIANQIAWMMYKGGNFILLSSINRGGFNVQRITSAQTFNASTVTTLVFNGANTNESTSFNLSNGVFTAPVTGMYVFTAGIFLQNSGVSNGILNAVYFSKNNATAVGSGRFDLNLGIIQQGGTVTAASNPWLVSGIVVVQMNVNDTMVIKLDLGTGWTAGFANFNIGSTFSGVRIE